jgi:Cu(I)/Ag(I) efflux system membrane fusion protein
VYSPELVSAQKELAIAQSLKLDTPGADPSAREAAHRLADAARERLANWQVGVKDNQVGSRITFASPVAGIVLEKKAVEGMRFAPGTTIYRIADLSTVWVIADVTNRISNGSRSASRRWSISMPFRGVTSQPKSVTSIRP